MKTTLRPLHVLFPLAALLPAVFAAVPEWAPVVKARAEAEYASLFEIQKDLHANPELSFMETRTAAILAKELRAVGIEVTEKVGNTGVVGVLRNGPGPTILIRGDMDALPLREEVPVPYASKAVVKDLMGRDLPAMHACGHDLHVTQLIGTARVLTQLKDKWSGTIVFIGQPAEEIVSGARAMLRDGLYTRFPYPDYALAIHVSASRPAGEINHTEGAASAFVNSVDITVRGVGGHGSAPHTTRDPVVLASQIVLALQTIVSRELKPGTPAVVTVGSIHGGTKHNIIGEEVKLEITLRSYSDDVARHLIASIKRICDNTARAYGLPEDRLPAVTVRPEQAPVMVNTPDLNRRLVGLFENVFGKESVVYRPPTMGAEDFSEFGRTHPKVPLMMWSIGAADPAKFAAAEKAGKEMWSNHSPLAEFVPDPTIKTCVASMVSAVLDLAPRK